MSLITFDLNGDQINDKSVRRQIMDQIGSRIPTGCNNRQAQKANTYTRELLQQIAVEGASESVLTQLNIPLEWQNSCEDFSHGKSSVLQQRFSELYDQHGNSLYEKLRQVGSVGAGNHFISGDVISI